MISDSVFFPSLFRFDYLFLSLSCARFILCMSKSRISFSIYDHFCEIQPFVFNHLQNQLNWFFIDGSQTHTCAFGTKSMLFFLSTINFKQPSIVCVCMRRVLRFQIHTLICFLRPSIKFRLQFIMRPILSESNVYELTKAILLMRPLTTLSTCSSLIVSI